MVRAYVHVCIARRCFNSKLTHYNKQFFSFPHNIDMCKKWLKNCDRTDLSPQQLLKQYKDYYICSDHFEDWCFTKCKTKLNSEVNPVPTIFNVGLLPIETLQEDCVDTSNIDLPANTSTDGNNQPSQPECCTLDTNKLLVEGDESTLSYKDCHVPEEKDFGPDKIFQVLIDLNPNTELSHIEDICRFCMQETNGNFVDMFKKSAESNKIRKICESVLRFKVDLCDGLPQKICSLCIKDLKTCYDILKRFKHAEEYLRAVAKYSLYVEEDEVSEKDLSWITNMDIAKLIPSQAYVVPLESFKPAEDLHPKTNSMDVDTHTEVCSVQKHNDVCPDSELLFEQSNDMPQSSSVWTENINCMSTEDTQDRTVLDLEKFDKDLKNSFSSSKNPKSEINFEKKLKIETLLNRFDSGMLKTITQTVSDLNSNLNEDKLPLSLHYNCGLCNASFTSFNFLEEHVSSNHAKKGCSCPICFEEFNGLKELKKHKVTDHPEFRIQCNQCGPGQEGFMNKAQLEAHVRAMHRYPCTKCKRICYSKERYDRHTLAKHKVDCSVCGKICKSAKIRLIHERTHTKSKEPETKETLVCWVCGAVISKNYFRIHLASHEEKKFLCEICSKRFSLETLLKAHLKTHSPEYRKKRFFCKQCPMSFWLKSSLRVHSYVHSTVKPHVCEFCGRGFIRSRNLKHHDQRRLETGSCPKDRKIKNLKMWDPSNYVEGKYSSPYENENNVLRTTVKRKQTETTKKVTEITKFECDICKRKFFSSRMTKRHKKYHFCNGDPDVIEKLLNEPEIYKCDVCKKLIKTKLSFDWHMRLHTKSTKPFKCQFCIKCFSSRNDYNIHEREHTGELPYQCSQCDQAFYRKEHLFRHETEHSDEKPFVCPICQKSFKRRKLLLVHTFRHKEASKVIRPYQCPKCWKSFVRKSTLTWHLTTHKEGESYVNSYSCSECGKEFPLEENLRKHKKTKHPKVTIDQNVTEEMMQEIEEETEVGDEESQNAIQYVQIIQDDETVHSVQIEGLQFITLPVEYSVTQVSDSNF